ncbi:hypothetical protein LTR95_002837 [Oleoguttula sp. CCFEE 5521]
MADSSGPRRSGRVRRAVKSYADEQAEDIKLAKPSKKKYHSHDDDDDALEVEDDCHEEEEVPADEPKSRKKSTKVSQRKGIGEPDDDGVMRLVTTMKRPPGEKRPPPVYPVPQKVKLDGDGKAMSLAAIMATSFEDRRQRQVSRIPRLSYGQVETRIKPTVPEATDSYETFLGRARTQKMVILERTRGFEEDCHANDDACPYHEIKIAGSTGNVYTVVISLLPTCSCPNTSFKSRSSGEGLCKHALYVLHYVLKAPEHLCYQTAFLTSELKEIDAGAPALPAQAIEEEAMDGKRKPMEGDCPICFMEFEEAEEATWCRAACSNNFHTKCFAGWRNANYGRVTCPLCRSEWEEADAPKPAGASMANVKMPAQHGHGGYYNVRDQLDYD